MIVSDSQVSVSEAKSLEDEDMQTTTTRPVTIDDQYARALARAKRSGIRICGRGKLRENGWPFVAVSSSKDPTRWHVVVIAPRSLVCDCFAGLRGMLCKHRALVHEELLCRWRAQREEIEAREEAALLAALLELHECHRILDDARARRVVDAAPAITQDTAGALLGSSRSARVLTADVRGYRDGAADVSPKPYVSNRPISIWK